MKMKKAKKQAKGIEERIQRREFYNTLKNPPPKPVTFNSEGRSQRRKTKLITANGRYATIERNKDGTISRVSVY